MKLSKYWSKLSLGSKIAALTSLLILLVISTLTYLSIQRERANYQSELTAQAALLLETIPLTIRDQIYRMELDEITDMARVVSKNEDVTRFIVYDQRGVVLVDSAQGFLTFNQEVDPLGQKLIEIRKDELYTKWQDDQLIVGDVIILGNQPIGAVAMGLSTESLVQKIVIFSRQGIVLGLITLVLGVGLSYLLGRQITTPLSELSNVAAEMAAGNLSIRADIQSQDEIGHLGDSFNQMVGAIQKRETELRELASGLEQTIAKRTAELRLQNEILEKMAITDPLTEIYNRRYFFDLAERELARSRRYGHPLSVVIIDLDNFKNLNDTFGHLVGDQVLIDFSNLCLENLRGADILARYGGDEFIILMPEADCEAAKKTAERLRNLVEEIIWVEGQAGKGSMTISLGVTCYEGGRDFSFDVHLFRADQALYISKNKGRNQVSVWEEGNAAISTNF